MKKLFFAVGFLLLFSALAFSGIIRESKSTVSFKGFGKYVTKTTTKISGSKSLSDSKKSFKGKGFMGGMMAKFILKPGHTADVIVLDSKTITQIDFKERTFRTSAIDDMEWNNYGKEEASESEEQNQEDEDSSIRIIKNEFKVTKTGESKEINGFPAKEYLINWVMVWEDTESGDRGTDSLSSHVWTTKLTSKMQKAQQEENAFFKKYAKAAGFEMDMQSQEMLGTKWLSMFRGLNHSAGAEKKVDKSAWANEMKKIKGYPVLTKGRYFTFRQKSKEKEEVKEEEEENDTPDFTNPKSVFGSIMKSAFKKKNKKKAKKSKKAKVRKADFSFRTELLKLESKSVPASAFKVPQGYEDISENRDQ